MVVSRNFYFAFSNTSGTPARYYLALFGDLRRFGDVIEGRVPVQGAPAALVGDWGEGKGGGGSVHDEQRKGEGEGGGRMRGASKRENLTIFNQHLTLVGLVGCEQTRA